MQTLEKILNPIKKALVIPILAAIPFLPCCSSSPPVINPKVTLTEKLAPKYRQLDEDYKNAVSQFDKAIYFHSNYLTTLAEKYPDLPQAHFIAGNGYLLSQDEDNCNKAIAEYDKAIELDPNYVAAYVNRGYAHSNINAKEIIQLYLTDGENMVRNGLPDRYKNFLEKAVEDYDKAIELNPSLFSAHLNRGGVLNMLNRPDKAMEDFDEAISLAYPDDPDAPFIPDLFNEDETEFLTSLNDMIISGFYKHMVQSVMTAQMPSGKKAVAIGQTIYERSDDDFLACAYMVKGNTYARADTRDYHSSMNYLNKAISINPGVPMIYQFRALSGVGIALLDQDFESTAPKEDMEKAQSLQARLIEVLKVHAEKLKTLQQHNVLSHDICH